MIHNHGAAVAVTASRADGPLVSRVSFRRYDNDSDARKRGTFKQCSARHLWLNCEAFAVVRTESKLAGATAVRLRDTACRACPAPHRRPHNEV